MTIPLLLIGTPKSPVPSRCRWDALSAAITIQCDRQDLQILSTVRSGNTDDKWVDSHDTSLLGSAYLMLARSNSADSPRNESSRKSITFRR